MDYFLIVCTLLAGILAVQRRLIWPFPLGIIVILLLSQIAFKYVHDGSLWNPFYESINYGGLTKQYLHTQLLFTLMAVGSLASIWTAAPQLNFTRVLNGFRAGNVGERFASTATALFCVVVLHFAFFFYSADWRTVWFHRFYLTSIVDESSVAAFGRDFPTIVVKSAEFAYIIAIFGCYLALNGRSLLLKVGFVLLAGFYFMLFLALHSRLAVAFPFFLALFYLVSSLKAKPIVITFLGIVCAFTITFCLTGRATAAHGFSSLGDTAMLVIRQPIWESLRSIWLNACEGIFGIAEAIQMDATFLGRYKMLSLSPLPSFLDGFDAIVWQDQYRLGKYVPMPGIIEAYHFGLTYCVAVVALMLLLVRSHATVAARSGPVFILCNMLIFIACYHMLAYPLRNALHFAWVALGLAAVALLAARQNADFRVRALPVRRRYGSRPI